MTAAMTTTTPKELVRNNLLNVDHRSARTHRLSRGTSCGNEQEAKNRQYGDEANT
jgi:hypothetical protein